MGHPIGGPVQHLPPAYLPPPPGVPHYDTLRRLEEESRRHIQASRQLNAYLASIMTNTAMSSSTVGGIHSYYGPAQLFPVYIYPC